MKKTVTSILNVIPPWNQEVSFYAIDLNDAQNVVMSKNCHVPSYPASSFKLAIFFSYAIKQAGTDLNASIGLLDFNHEKELFPIIEKTFPYGLKLTIRECLRAVMRVSDNRAANTLANRIGFEGINAILQSHGFHQSKIDMENLSGRYASKVSLSAHDGCALLYGIETGHYGKEIRDLAYDCMGTAGHWLKNVSGIRKGGDFTMSPTDPGNFVRKYCKENVQSEFAVIHNQKLGLRYVIGIQTKFRSLKRSSRDFDFAKLQKHIEKSLLEKTNHRFL